MTAERDDYLLTAQCAAEMHAIYRMFDGNGQLLYIGRTADAGRRFGEHASKRWFPLVDTIKLQWFPTESDAAHAERLAIRTERPRYNVQENRTLRPIRVKPSGVLDPVAAQAERQVMVGLLARGTTIREAAITLGLSKWYARRQLEALRAEGVAQINGERRGARWVLAHPPGPAPPPMTSESER